MLLVAALLCAACGSKSQSSVAAPDTPSAAPSPADAALVDEARRFVAEMDADLRSLYVEASVAAWANETDITTEHEAAAARAAAAQATGVTRWIKAARRFEPVLTQLDATTRRQLGLLKLASQPAPDDPAKADELARLGAEMSSIFGRGKVCGLPGDAECRDLDGLSKVLQTTRDPARALAAWKGWHDEVGRAERDAFVRFVGLANDGARDVGFDDVGAMWRGAYDMPPEAFEAEVDRLYAQMKPLYEQLHCYTRRKLNELYGDAVVQLFASRVRGT